MENKLGCLNGKPQVLKCKKVNVMNINTCISLPVSAQKEGETAMPSTEAPHTADPLWPLRLGTAKSFPIYFKWPLELESSFPH